jgi:hypothetical protein
MFLSDISRRGMLKASGVAGVTAVSGGALPALPKVFTATPLAAQKGERASLAAWVRMRSDGGSLITVAAAQNAGDLPPVWEPVLSHYERAADPHSPWHNRQYAYDTARALLVTTAARRWDADPRDCRIENGQIAYTRNGRRLGYVIWTDFS